MIEAIVLIAIVFLSLASLIIGRYSLALAALWLILLAIVVGYIAMPSGWLLRLLALVVLIVLGGVWLDTRRLSHVVRRMKEIDDEWWEKAQVSGWEETYEDAMSAADKIAFLKNPEAAIDYVYEKDEEWTTRFREEADKMMAKAGYEPEEPDTLRDRVHWIRFIVYLSLLKSGFIEAGDWTPPRAVSSRLDRLD